MVNGHERENSSASEMPCVHKHETSFDNLLDIASSGKIALEICLEKFSMSAAASPY